MNSRPSSLQNPAKKILFIRLDKIGDLVCTLPVDQVAKFATAEKHWVISKGLGFMAQQSDPVRKFTEIPSKKYDSETFQKFFAFLKQENFDEAYSFQAPWWVNYALWKAKIPQRSGVLSKWHSFLFLNHGIRQKRSESSRHEFEYNLQLVDPSADPSQLFLKLEAPNVSLSESLQEAAQSPFVVVHAGMAGSALNWPQAKFVEWIQSFLAAPEFSNYKVLLTGTDADLPYLDQIFRDFATSKDSLKTKNPRLINLVSKLKIQELLLVLKKSSVVLAPSTGVLHLACALQRPTVSLYSPIQVHHPKRWGPRSETTAKVFLPEVACPAKFRCLGPSCKHYQSTDCMNLISSKDVLNAVREILKAGN